jgi:hypothetical protein
MKANKELKLAIAVLLVAILVFSLYPRFAGNSDKYEDA